MNAYTSKHWSSNGPTAYPGDPRTIHDVERRDYQSDIGIRQNGISDNYAGKDSPHSSSPMTCADSPAYNRSVCDGEEYGRSPPVAYPRTYSPPPPHERTKYLQQEPRRPNYHNFNGGPPPPRAYMQRPPDPHHIRGSEPSHVRGYPWRQPPVRPPSFYHNGHRPPPASFGRSPILRSPSSLPYRPHSPADNYHSYQDMNVASVDRDPRLHNKSSAEVFPQGNHLSVLQYSKDPPVVHKLLPDIDQINREHSYYDRSQVGVVVTQKFIESTDSSALPQSHLSVVPKRFLILTSKPVPQEEKTKSILRSSKQPEPAIETVIESTPNAKEMVCWPVYDGFPLEGFSMDLDPDVDSGVDSASEEDSTDAVDSTINTLIVHESTSSLTNGVRTELSDEESSIQTSDEGTRKRKRPRIEDVPSVKRLEEEMSPIADVVGVDKAEQLVDKAVSRVKDELKKGKRKAKKRLNAPKPSEKRAQTRKVKGAPSKELSTELKSLLSGDFKPEILTTRSRGESLTLARRQVMEKEIEQHERERILTSRDPEVVDTEDMVSNVSYDVVMDGASDYSAATTPSYSQDQGSSSQDMESASLPSCDSTLDQFSPELIARCKRISSAKSSGDTPLHKVCRNGRIDMVQCLLVALKFNPNQADNAGWTPLHEACCNNHPHIANLLLRNGADANASARDGTRPIHDATEIGSIEIVKSLIQHGADPTAEVGDKTPLDIAKAENRPEIYSYLLPVVKEHQDRINAQKAAVAPPAVVRRRSARTAAVKPLKEQDDEFLSLQVDGFGSNDPSFGTELDYPLFYICPQLELSETPMLPVYNFEIVPGSNPRRHNFYLLTDLLQALSMNESELRQHCDMISALEMTVGEVITNLKHAKYNRHMTIPTNLKTMSKLRKVKFLPVCSQLRALLGVETVNLED